MFQKFFTDTIECKFIKSLLYNTPLPTIPTIADGDYIAQGFDYINKNDIIRCTKSGIFGVDATYVNVGNYVFGNEYLFTERFISSNNMYDSKTHEMLGKYIRCYRDTMGIDLMPFYNCFSAHSISDIYWDNENKLETGKNNLYKVFIIPIKFNKIYNVAIDCSTTLKVGSAIINDFGKIKSVPYEPLATTKTKTRFQHPFIFQVDCDDTSILKYERDLYMVLQIPSTNTSSITIIEGDYSNNVSIANVPQSNPQQINKMFTSKLKLTMMNDGEIYAFSDRLIEYLLLNVIDGNDTIDNNFGRIQKAFNLPITNVWESNMRYIIYDAYMSSSNFKYDITGYVDKDVEKFLKLEV